MASNAPRPSFSRRKGTASVDREALEAFAAQADSSKEEQKAFTEKPRLQRKAESKKETVTFNLRLPKAVHNDLCYLSEATGMSMQQVCLTLLLPLIEEEKRRFEQ